MNAPAQLHENPLGLDGFEFVEFTSPDPEALAGLFTGMGFTHLGNHKTKNVRRYGQGDINFILNMEPSGQAAAFRKAHGPSANGMAFRVKNARQAFEMAVERGATPGPDGARAGGTRTSPRSKGSAAPISIWSIATAPSRSTMWTSNPSPAPRAKRMRLGSTRSITSPTM
jgi:4-hydroxyphenylpyruvate dioxygenase-like putative hemolysin